MGAHNALARDGLIGGVMVVGILIGSIPVLVCSVAMYSYSWYCLSARMRVKSLGLTRGGLAQRSGTVVQIMYWEDVQDVSLPSNRINWRADLLTILSTMWPEDIRIRFKSGEQVAIPSCVKEREEILRAIDRETASKKQPPSSTLSE
jgi:hypothetical protein